LPLRSHLWFHSRILFRSRFAQRRLRTTENRLFGHRCARFFREGPRRRQELGSLGKIVLGEKGFGRTWGKSPPRRAGIALFAQFGIKMFIIISLQDSLPVFFRRLSPLPVLL